MLCTNIWLLSSASVLFGGLAILFATVACVLAIVAFCRELAYGGAWAWSALTAATAFAQFGSFAADACAGHGYALLARLVSSALLAMVGLALTARYRPEAYAL